jgi:hypothetical protein
LHHHPNGLTRAFHTSEGSPAKPHHAAAYADREDDTAPGKRCSSEHRKTLQNDMRLDDSLGPLASSAGASLPHYRFTEPDIYCIAQHDLYSSSRRWLRSRPRRRVVARRPLGFANSAAHAAFSALKIRAQTGHSSDAMLGRHLREDELFTGKAASHF